MSHDTDAEDLRWGREQERREDADYRPRRRPRYRCGGYASATGHCGDPFCLTCYPSGPPLGSECEECGGETEDGRCLECGAGEEG